MGEEVNQDLDAEGREREEGRESETVCVGRWVAA